MKNFEKMRGAIEKTCIKDNFLVAQFILLSYLLTCWICSFPAAAGSASCWICPFPAINPRALFRINIMIAGNIRYKNMTVRRSGFLTLPMVALAKNLFYRTNLSAQKACLIVTLLPTLTDIKIKK
jgi:hypothetical protein